MDNRDRFEEILQTKMEGLEKAPSSKVDYQFKNRLNKQNSDRISIPKVILWIVGSIAIAMVSFQYLQNKLLQEVPNEKIEIIPQANHIDTKKFHKNDGFYLGPHNHNKNLNEKAKLLVAQPSDIKNKAYIQTRLKAQAENKLIFIHAFNMDCSHCQKMKELTLANKEVQAFLQEHFVKINIDLQLEENIEVIRFYGIKTSPSFLFLNGDGQIVAISNGFQEPEKFITILEKAMEEEAAGSYIDLMSRKRVNPTPDKLQTLDNLATNDLPKDIQLLTAKVFPNPTSGIFNAEVKGQKSPLHLKIIDLDGRVLLEETQTEFNGNQNHRFDLTNKKGQFIIQFTQGKSIIYKKIIVQ